MWRSIALVGINLLFASLPVQATISNQKPAEAQTRKCCVYGIGYESGGGIVVFEKICQTKKASTFHFRMENVGFACTHPPSTILKDDKGRKYRMINHGGLPDCESGKRSRSPNVRFQWTFEAIRKDAKRIDLVEVEDEATAGLSYWAWREIDVAKCKF